MKRIGANVKIRQPEDIIKMTDSPVIKRMAVDNKAFTVFFQGGINQLLQCFMVGIVKIF